jgi:hypothetical protein
VTKGTEVLKESFQQTGLYLLNLESLMKGTLPDCYKIQGAIVGKSNDMCFSMFAQSVVFI